jgi:hypothetical protein
MNIKLISKSLIYTFRNKVTGIFHYLKENILILKIYLVFLFFVTLAQLVLGYFTGTFEGKNLYSDLEYNIFYIWGLIWDGTRYFEIMQNGYTYPDYAFFPGYPLVLKFFSFILPGQVLVRINVFFMIVLIYLIHKFMFILGIEEKHRLKTLVLFLCYPFSIFLLFGYAETLYLIFSIGFLIYISKNNFFGASIMSFILGFFKISVVCIPLIFLYKMYNDKFLITSFSKDSIYRWFKYFIYSGLSIGGVLLYFGYLEIYKESFMQFFIAQGEWGRMDYFKLFDSSYLFNFNEFYINFIFEIIVLFFLFYIFIKFYSKIKPEFYLFSLFHLLIPLSTGTTISITRFSLYAFPILLMTFSSIAENKRYFYIVISLFVIFYLLNIFIICKGGFIG